MWKFSVSVGFDISSITNTKLIFGISFEVFSVFVCITATYIKQYGRDDRKYYHLLIFVWVNGKKELSLPSGWVKNCTISRLTPQIIKTLKSPIWADTTTVTNHHNRIFDLSKIKCNDSNQKFLWTRHKLRESVTLSVII